MVLTASIIANLRSVMAAAEAAGHPHPGIAAAEAAVETRTDNGGWFTSPLWVKSNNYLGLKAPSWYRGAVVEMPTREFLPKGYTRPATWRNPRSPITQPAGTSWLIDDDFCHFLSVADCARCQMIVLQRNKSYAPAFLTASAEDFARVVSKVWSTGPGRGDTVVSIYDAHQDILAPHVAAQVTA